MTTVVDVQHAIALIAKELSVEPSAVSLDADFVQDLSADEVKLTDLFLGLEEAFDVTIEASDVARLTTLSSVLRYLDDALGKKTDTAPGKTPRRGRS